MDFYMYKSTCPRWYGEQIDIRHMVVPEKTGEDEVSNRAKLNSNRASGSKTCRIELLQKYFMSIEPKKSYVGLTGLQFHGNYVPSSGNITTNDL
uniref:Uncharacterized protein n=1 Tax=viral metagenome TaxID=1070528 RepID=A0A6C0C2W9_9ZZZZ